MQDEIKAIEQEIADFAKEQAECLERIRALQAEEDPAKGIFRNEEIHAAKQNKLRLDFEILHRRAKMKRLRLG